MLRVSKPKDTIMIRALSALATAHLEARAKRRTVEMISSLPESVQKDIGWKWTPNRAAPGRSAIDWDLM